MSTIRCARPDADVAENMADWDEEKLRNVVTQNGRKQANATDVGRVAERVWGELTISDRLQILHSGYRRQEVRVVVSVCLGCGV